jgi:hypothetical protein
MSKATIQFEDLQVANQKIELTIEERARRGDAQIEALQAELEKKQNIMRVGHYFEEVPVEVKYNQPTRGMKTKYDARNGQIVSQEPMTDNDRQRSLLDFSN